MLGQVPNSSLAHPSHIRRAWVCPLSRLGPVVAVPQASSLPSDSGFSRGLTPSLHLYKGPRPLVIWTHDALLLSMWRAVRGVPTASVWEGAAQLPAGSAGIPLVSLPLDLCLQTSLTRAGGAQIKGAGPALLNLPTEKAFGEDVILSENGGAAGHEK